MARVIEDLGQGGTTAKYPWSEWTDGHAYLAERGVDFTISDISFRSNLYDRAKKDGLKVHVKIRPEGVAFQFRPNGKT